MVYYINMKQNNKKLTEDGFAPLIVSMIIITVLSLMTVGFILLMDNNQNNVFHRQLNNDAYYAAESGINDAIQAINHGFDVPKTTCPPLLPPYTTPGSIYLKNNQLQPSSGDYYSCLLINPKPSLLQYSSVKSSQPTVAIISAINPTATSLTPEVITRLEISWQPSAQIAKSPYSFAPAVGCSASSSYCFPPEGNWVSSNGHPLPGVIRIALTPLQSGPLPTDTSTTYTGFFYPLAGSSSTPGTAPLYSGSTIGASSGELASGNCSNSLSTPYTPDACNVIIPLPSGINGYSNFLMELRSIYNPSMVTITAYNGSTKLLLRNAQTVIDSTGDSGGVLKRIQVTIPTINYNGFPAYDLGSSETICSNLNVYPSNQTTGTSGGYISKPCGFSS